MPNGTKCTADKEPVGAPGNKAVLQDGAQVQMCLINGQWHAIIPDVNDLNKPLVLKLAMAPPGQNEAQNPAQLGQAVGAGVPPQNQQDQHPGLQLAAAALRVPADSDTFRSIREVAALTTGNQAFNITKHVSQAIKDKIVSNQYVDFATLLDKAPADPKEEGCAEYQQQDGESHRQAEETPERN